MKKTERTGLQTNAQAGFYKYPVKCAGDGFYRIYKAYQKPGSGRASGSIR